METSYFMETSHFEDEVLKSAFNKYSQHNFDMDHADSLSAIERERIENWHKCLAWAIDELDLSPIDKLQLFSQCVLDIESTITRMRSIVGIKEKVPF